MSKIVVENTSVTNLKNLGEGYYTLTISPFSRTSRIKAGQFVHLKIPCPEIYFRRAFSVYHVNHENNSLAVIFKTVGRGTAAMADMKKGDTIDVLGPLGNGFKRPGRSSSVILIAGGIGMPPIYFFARQLIEKDYRPENLTFFYGGYSRPDLVDLKLIKKLGVRIVATTIDGSYGFKGLVTEAVENTIPELGGRKNIYACGPTGMLRAVDNLATKYKLSGQISLEAPMPCGIGICLGCILPLKKGGYTRVCREGPVYNMGEVIL
jgi:dihydroorotate dehydrogenase electron transfer subunit